MNSENVRPFFFKSVGGNVGEILAIYKYVSASKCLRVSNEFISTNTLSVFTWEGFLKDLLIDSGLISVCKIVNSNNYKGHNLYKGILFCC